MLNKNDLLNIGLKRKEVKLENGSVLIREFTTADREKFEVLAMSVQSGTTQKSMKASIIAISLINKDNTRVFGDDEIGKISELPSTVTEAIFNEILEINGMAGDALEVAEGN